MPLVQRSVGPVKLSAAKLELSKTDSEFIAVNNGTLVSVLKQLASLVTHAGAIFSEVATLTEQVSKRVRSVKLRLDELEAKAELFDPKLVPVPEGCLDDVSIQVRTREVVLESRLFSNGTRPRFLFQLYEKAGKHEPSFPVRSPIAEVKTRRSAERNNSIETRRPASFAALRDWKLDDYLDERIATLDRKKKSSEELNRALSSPFPSQLVQVDVTGRGFDRMKANRRSLIIHTKKVRSKKRRNTICGSMPNKECGIQTSFSSVATPTDNKKYGIDSGHWSSCTSSAQEGVCIPSSSSAPSPWDPNSLSTSSDFLFDDEDRCLTPQLENFTDGLVSDSDSVDTEGYFTSFRNECGFPKSKKSTKDKEEKSPSTATENEYELFGKGSTSTTASSCGTVVLRNKPDPPARTTSAEHLIDKKAQSDDADWEERVKRKSLIERVPSLVVVTPSPSCSSGSPPPLKDPGLVLEPDDSDSGIITPKAGFMHGSECGTLSDTDSDRRGEIKLSDLARPCSTNSTASSSNSTLTLTSCSTNLPQPDVIPDVQQLQIIRTMSTPKLDISREYYSLDTVLLGSSEEEHHDSSSSETKTSLPPATSGKVRGARVVLDANGEIIFSSDTLRRKRRQKVSFDPGNAVKTQDYESSTNYARIRESVYERIQKDTNDKLYECIEEIRRHNLRASDALLEEKTFGVPSTTTAINPAAADKCSSRVPLSPRAKVNVLLETDLDSAIPPVMPELKNLPKIKDRLKRNESYRIATDEIPPRPPLHSLSNKRMNLTNNKNIKRDIPEEDPVFIQQILNMSNTTNNISARSPTTSDSMNRITLSKFALSPDDRPSFLRRESPPTMDEIAKEIYRFRKKFNIQPNASSSNHRLSLRSPSPCVSSTSTSSTLPSASVNSNKNNSTTPNKSTTTTPHIPQIRTPTPLATSTPVKSSTSSFQRLFPTRNSYSQFPSPPSRVITPATLRSSLYGSSRVHPTKIGVNPKDISNDRSNCSTLISSPFRKSFSDSSRLGGTGSRPGTSLGDFKKLLQATQRKKSPISAMEILKPRIGLETTL